MTISSRKLRILLACLALDLNRPLSSNSLTDRLWDDHPPRTAPGTLHGYLSKLRTVLREANELDAASGWPPVEIVSHSGTYALRAETDQVDWQVYHHLSVRARTLAEAGDDLRALAVLDRAAAVWRGEPLAGLPGLWVQQARSRLLDRRSATALTRFEVELRLGRFADLVPDLTALAEQQPGNEQIAAHLMTALYGCGRVSDALAVYRRIQRLVYRDLGTRTGERLNRLQEGILRGDNAADLVGRPAVRPVATVPSAAPGRRAPTLPPAPELVGREVELELITAAARGEWPTRTDNRTAALPVVALSGLPGSGKTALALAAAHRLSPEFPDGTFLLRLDAHSSAQPDPGPETAATVLLRQFGVPAAEIPFELDELLARCRELLSHRRALVVLDDAAGPGQVGPLLPTAPSCFVLVTSRHRMAELPTVSSVPLDVLTPDAAATMFTRLIGPDRAADPHDLATVTDLCSRHPLALHLAASRFRSHPAWSLAHLADRLSRNGRLGELRDGGGSLERAFSMSYQALRADQQVALRRLSLHPGGSFGAYLAAALISCTTDAAERLVEDLLAVHLVDELTPERFDCHDLVREFAQDVSARSDPPSERSAATDRLVSAAVRALDLADRTALPHRFRLPLPDRLKNAADDRLPHVPQWSQPGAARTWLSVETPGLLVLERRLRITGENDRAAWFAHLLAPHLEADGFWHEALHMHLAARDHWRSNGEARQEQHSLLALASIQLRFSRRAEAEASAERALQLARTTNDPEGRAEALGRFCELHWERGDYARALDLLQEVLALRRSIGNEWQLARALNNLGLLNARTGNLESAREFLSEALDVFVRLGDEKSRLQALNNLGGLLVEIGDTGAARKAFAQVAHYREEPGNRLDRAIAQLNLAQCASLPEESDEASALLQSAIRVFRALGSTKNELDAVEVLAALHRRAGRSALAAALQERAHTLAAQIDSPPGQEARTGSAA
ncbi:BTAD domain-containing putative transcriptional regulator [Kitasatospora phosalacinea]|uniref:BTAD domain-containing putative transcriptional regulator n=1 Tax=Kitasatospora phosalacinea TaxID=2065 RepID=A0ABW6GEY0_9ACTN